MTVPFTVTITFDTDTSTTIQSTTPIPTSPGFIPAASQIPMRKRDLEDANIPRRAAASLYETKSVPTNRQASALSERMANQHIHRRYILSGWDASYSLRLSRPAQSRTLLGIQRPWRHVSMTFSLPLSSINGLTLNRPPKNHHYCPQDCYSHDSC